MKQLERVIATHPFFRGLTRQDGKFLAACASSVRFEAGQHLFREGDDSTAFYVIRRGKVAIELFVPGEGPITIQTLEKGDLVGWSWLVPPHRKQFDARALTEIVAVQFDAKRLRQQCDEDPQLGYQLLKRFAGLLGARLQATRFQLLDVYGVAR